MTFWLQRHNFSSDTLEDATYEDGLAALTQFDWASELEKEAEALSKGRDCCPPGAGFVAEDQRILHLCPRDPRTAILHYLYPQTSKIFGFIPCPKQETLTLERIQIRDFRPILEAHAKGDHLKVLELMRRSA